MSGAVIDTLQRADVQTFLRHPRFAVLATINADGTPQQSTIWYELQGDEVLMNTARGRVKERNMRRDPRVSVCLEDEYRYITLSGCAVLIDNQQIAQRDIKALATRYHGVETAERQSRDQFAREQRVSVRVRIERLVLYGFPD